MNALALVPKFQERLEVSRANAIWRVIGFLFLSACFVVVIVLAATFFPYTASFTEEVSLLPGNHIQVEEILDGEVLLNGAQFLEIAQGNTIFVSLGEKTITYMAKVAGVSYRYDQVVPLRWNYFVSSQKIQQNEILVREINRNVGVMIIVHIIIPLIALAMLFVLRVCIQGKRVSGQGRDAVFRTV